MGNQQYFSVVIVVVMLALGLTLTVDDFKRVAERRARLDRGRWALSTVTVKASFEAAQRSEPSTSTPPASHPGGETTRRTDTAYLPLLQRPVDRP